MALTLLAICPVFADDPTPEKPIETRPPAADDYYVRGLGYYPSIYHRKLSARREYDDLKAWIAARQLASPDALLEAFAADPYYRGFLDHYSLMYASQSRQKHAVSPEFPRVLMHHPRSRLVLAVTGDPKHESHYAQVEVIELPPGGTSFEFHLIDFARKQSPFLDEPKSCRACHGESSRPIWGTYRLWPGAFGGFDDRLPIPRERERWKSFTQNGWRVGRYAKLAPLDFRILSSALIGSRVNDMTNEILNDLNNHRLAHKLAKSTAWPKYRFAIVGTLRLCTPLELFFPEDAWKQHEARLKTTFQGLKAEARRSARAEFHARATRMALVNDLPKAESLDVYPADPDAGIRYNFDDGDGIFDDIARMRFVLDGQDIDPALRMGDWSISFNVDEPGDFSVANVGVGSFSWLNDHYLKPLIHRTRAAEAKQLFETSCEDLAKKSRAALAR